jgi:multiple sugar transport system permease protein
MMSSQWGILNLISEDLGLGTHHWLASRWTAITALIIFHIWKYLPFWTVIILAARRGIPRQLYEAAAIDGAGCSRPSATSRSRCWRHLPHLLAALHGLHPGRLHQCPADDGRGAGRLHSRARHAGLPVHLPLGKIDWGVGVFATALPVTLLFIFILIRKIK